MSFAVGPLFTQILEHRHLWKIQSCLLGLVDRDAALSLSNLPAAAIFVRS
jgi:hypothetical protein